MTQFTSERMAFDQLAGNLAEQVDSDGIWAGTLAVQGGTAVRQLFHLTNEPPTITAITLHDTDNKVADIVRVQVLDSGDVSGGKTLSRNEPDILEQPAPLQLRMATDGVTLTEEVPGILLRQLAEDISHFEPDGAR